MPASSHCIKLQAVHTFRPQFHLKPSAVTCPAATAASSTQRNISARMPAARVLERENEDQLGQTELECIHTERIPITTSSCILQFKSLIPDEKAMDVSLHPNMPDTEQGVVISSFSFHQHPRWFFWYYQHRASSSPRHLQMLGWFCLPKSSARELHSTGSSEHCFSIKLKSKKPYKSVDEISFH